MATYKVLQDIEAEDKLIGPLTLRQFVYAGVCVLNLYLCFFVTTKGAFFMAVIFLPIAVVAGFFAWPWGRDQPTEVWALAKVRFLLKPRKRIWNQSGIKELVTVTVPKKIERVRTNGLNETEVRSRLRALADTIDSRGWAIKNVNVNLYGQTPLVTQGNDPDRLLNVSALPQEVQAADIRPADDMLDVANNPVARQFDTMIAASEKAHRDRIIEQMNQSAPEPAGIQAPVAPRAAQPAAQTPQNNYWFLNQPQQMGTVPQNTVTFNTQVVAPGASVNDLPVSAAVPTADEEALVRQLASQDAMQRNNYGHLHTIQPLSAQKPPVPPLMQPRMQLSGLGTPAPYNPVAATAGPVAAYPVSGTAPGSAAPQDDVTPPRNTDILDLATNKDLSVATLAREAHKRHELSEDEVVISLH